MRYLNSFKPLCINKRGRRAAERYDLPPFIDASIRREPDFESPFPSISALCRGAKFTPRLQEGDTVAYMTVRRRYEPERFAHWRLIAILRVHQRFESHKQAAAWYQDKGLPLPSNCMVESNEAVPYEMTSGAMPSNRFGDGLSADEIVKRWDARYKLRARKNGVFLACEAEFLELSEPPVITEATMLQIFGRIPPTRNPPPISESEYVALRALTVTQLQ